MYALEVNTALLFSHAPCPHSSSVYALCPLATSSKSSRVNALGLRARLGGGYQMTRETRVRSPPRYDTQVQFPVPKQPLAAVQLPIWRRIMPPNVAEALILVL